MYTEITFPGSKKDKVHHDGKLSIEVCRPGVFARLTRHSFEDGPFFYREAIAIGTYRGVPFMIHKYQDKENPFNPSAISDTACSCPITGASFNTLDIVTMKHLSREQLADNYKKYGNVAERDISPMQSLKRAIKTIDMYGDAYGALVIKMYPYPFYAFCVTNNLLK